jgi:hypothetical protein
MSVALQERLRAEPMPPLQSTRILLVLAAVLCIACTHPQPGPLPPRKAAAPHPATRELGRPAAEVERLIESAPFELRDVKRAERGVMGVSKATAHFPQQRVDLPVKWAPAPPASLHAWNAEPRKEIAAFAVQQWFLDPDHWIVPPTAIRCVPLSEYPASETKPAPTVQGTRCVLGLVAAWLKDVKPPEVIYDPTTSRRTAPTPPASPTSISDLPDRAPRRTRQQHPRQRRRRAPLVGTTASRSATSCGTTSSRLGSCRASAQASVDRCGA